MNWRTKASRIAKVTRAIYFAFGVVVGLLVDALSIPKSLVEFKTHISEATEYLAEFLYRPEIWTGKFDTYPEGFVDMGDMNIWSGVEAALEMEVFDFNRLDGRVWWKGSCSLGSPYQGLLLEGRIDFGGSSADVEVYDVLNGHRTSFFKGRLENDGVIVHFTDFPAASGLNGSRIASNPEPATLEHWGELHCDWAAPKFQDNSAP